MTMETPISVENHPKDSWPMPAMLCTPCPASGLILQSFEERTIELPASKRSATHSNGWKTSNSEGFHQCWYSKMDGLEWKNPKKWMVDFRENQPSMDEKFLGAYHSRKAPNFNVHPEQKLGCFIHGFFVVSSWSSNQPSQNNGHSSQLNTKFCFRKMCWYVHGGHGVWNLSIKNIQGELHNLHDVLAWKIWRSYMFKTSQIDSNSTMAMDHQALQMIFPKSPRKISQP